MTVQSVRSCDYCGKIANNKTGMMPPDWVHIAALRDNEYYDFDACPECAEKDPTIRLILEADP